MFQSIGIIAATIITAACLAALFWGRHRRREDKRRRKQGIITIPVGAGHMVTAGCLGVLGYLGLLFVLLTLTFGLVEQADAPNWLAGVAAIGLLAGFFIMVGWAVFGIGKGFAMTRLVVDKERIRLIRRGRTKTVIFWNKRWRLERMARLQQVGSPALGGDTGYSLLMRLRQGRKELTLAFDVPGEEIGGLPAYDGPDEGHSIIDDAEWLRSEILFRYERWDEAAEAKQLAVEVDPDAFTVLAPGAAVKDALSFTEEDLVLNRDGLASEVQSRSIRGDLKLTLATYLVLAAVFGAGGLYSLLRLLQGGAFDAFGPWLIVLFLATGFCALMALVTGGHFRSEILVERLSGRVRLQHYRGSNEYWLRLGDQAYPITKQSYEALKDEAAYHLYVARYGIGAQDSKLLSAEELASPRSG